jgi:hypothetical protein
MNRPKIMTANELHLTSSLALFSTLNRGHNTQIFSHMVKRMVRHNLKISEDNTIAEVMRHAELIKWISFQENLRENEISERSWNSVAKSMIKIKKTRF